MQQTNWLIRTDHPDGIVELGLNRGPVNALCPAFLMDFAAMMQDLGGDDAVRGVVLSSPFKVFSAGLDLKEAQEFDVEQQHAIVEGLNVAFLALFACPKPTVAAVNGAAIAGGLFFVLASDFRVSGPRGKFGLAEVRVGADFPVGPLEIARATLSANDMRRMMLTGQPVTAEASAASGIVDMIAPEDEVVERAVRAATDMAGSPAGTYASVKRQIRGDVIAKITTAMEAGANTPEGGWFTSETKAAMQRMIG